MVSRAEDILVKAIIVNVQSHLVVLSRVLMTTLIVRNHSGRGCEWG